MTKKFLFVGEGDFSFSYSVSQSVWNNKDESIDSRVNDFMGTASIEELKASTVIASSYDSEEDLIAKYPEVSTYFPAMREMNSVSLQHNVNAWKLNESFPEGTSFDGIVWNHPHLGLEDCKLHSCLIAHFFDSAKTVLSTSGFVQISLLAGQIPRWSVVEQAERNGFALTAAFALENDAFPKFTAKRNERAQSFKNGHVARHHLGHLSRTDVNSAAQHGGLDSWVMRFQRRDVVLAANPEFAEATVRETLRIGIEESAKKAVEAARAAEEEENALCRVVNIEFARTFRLNSRTGKREAKQDTVKRTSQYTSFKCQHCGRIFKEERGASTHILNSHPNAQPDEVCEPKNTRAARLAAAAAANASADVLAERLVGDNVVRCTICEKDCADDAALEQHLKAKHGADGEIAFQEHLKTSRTTEDAEAKRAKLAMVTCKVCGEEHPEGEETAHLERMVPSVALDLPCTKPGCGKKFKDERALRQHANFCKAEEQKAEEPAVQA